MNKKNNQKEKKKKKKKQVAPGHFVLKTDA